MVVPPTIRWTKPKYERFYTLVQNAYENGMTKDHTITFEGHVFMLGYAKYLLEYLESRVYHDRQSKRTSK